MRTKFFIVFFAGILFTSCSLFSSKAVNFQSALNTTTRTLSLSGANIGHLTGIEKGIPQKDDQLRVNQIIASDAGIDSVDPNAFIFFENLVTLDFSSNNLTEFAVASKTINDIKLSSNNLTSVNVFEVPNGHNIWLDRNKISDLKWISLSKDVLELSLAHNDIADVSGLSVYPLLRILDLSYNKLDVADLEELKKLPRLATVKLQGNDISEAQIIEFQKFLDKRFQK